MPKKLSITVSVPLPFTVSMPPSSESISASRGGVCNVGGGAGLGGGGAGLGGGGTGLGGGDTRCSPNWLLLFVEPAPTVTLIDPLTGVVIVKSENDCSFTI